MAHKNDYSIVVFFESTTPKKWSYVHRINGFAKFLDSKHSAWKYINVYERRTGKFIKRFNKGAIIPDFIQ